MGGSSMAATAQLFARLTQEIEEARPKNCIHFVVDFLCKHYPEHLHGFASIWQMDPDLERERHEVVNFFKAHKISTAVAAHFTNAGYDTLDTLTTLNKETLVDVEAFNNVKWLPGHKVRLQQIFGEISARVRAYRQQYGNSGQKARPSAHHVIDHHATSSYASPAHTYPTTASYAPAMAVGGYQAPQLMNSGSHLAPQPIILNHYSPAPGAVQAYNPTGFNFNAGQNPALAALPAPPNGGMFNFTPSHQAPF